MKKTLHKLLCALLAALTLTGVSLAATREDVDNISSALKTGTTPEGRNFPPGLSNSNGGTAQEGRNFSPGFSDSTVSPEDSMGAAPEGTPFPPEFTDMDSDDIPASIREAVRKAQLQGAVAGYADGSFRPLNGVTRGAFAKMSMEFLNETDRSLSVSMKDVKPNNSFYAYVATVVRKGYMKGYTENFFGVADPVTRQQECAVIGRVLLKQGKLKTMTEEKIATQIGKYKDSNQITISDARACVAYLTQKGVIKPDAAGKFNPTHNMNRGETVELLCALLDVPSQS